MKIYKEQSLEQETKDRKSMCTRQQGRTNCSMCLFEALGSISIVPIKQPTDTENVCVKILSKKNDPKLSGAGSQKQ